MHWESWPTRSGTRELGRGRGHPGTRQKLVQNPYNVVVLGEFKRDNPANHLGIRRAVLSYPSEDLRDGVFLVDTPAWGLSTATTPKRPANFSRSPTRPSSSRHEAVADPSPQVVGDAPSAEMQHQLRPPDVFVRRTPPGIRRRDRDGHGADNHDPRAGLCVEERLEGRIT
jgi:hypothetical protein